MKKITELTFEHCYSSLPSSLYSLVTPQPLSHPFLVHINPYIAQKLALDITPNQHSSFIKIFSGQSLLPNFKPLAMKYTGHQFGHYNPDLGDGRGLLLGEIKTDNNKWDLHLKGSGKTPYSRMGDGRAVLRSTIREYLASTALDGLGIATTHALAIIGSQTKVERETSEYAANLVRIAESHLRFGHFEYLFYSHQHQALKQLADYVIEHHFSALNDSASPYDALFSQICQVTAEMIAAWQAVGFCHGVMNTDNMSILGLTFDYGPYGFIENYDPSHICNHSDHSGRYAFDQQPAIGAWNLSALGYALTPLIDQTAIDKALNHYQNHLQRQYSYHMRNKLGLVKQLKIDTQLFSDLFQLLQQYNIDYTLFFRTLSHIPKIELSHCEQQFSHLLTTPQKLTPWLYCYQQRLDLETDDPLRLSTMQNHNPKYILRNYLAQQAIEQAQQGRYQLIDELLTVLQTPFCEHEQFEHFAQLSPSWGKQLIISCSS